MIEIEIQLAKAFNWSLYDIDETDASHLMEFINHLTGGSDKTVVHRAYIDEVSWI
jgi:hypothetical protein